MDELLGDPTSESALVALHIMEDDDPAACSELLARASERCTDDAIASDWLAEAARLMTTRCGDLQRGLELWSRALRRDPLNARAAEELANKGACAILPDIVPTPMSIGGITALADIIRARSC